MTKGTILTLPITISELWATHISELDEPLFLDSPSRENWRICHVDLPQERSALSLARWKGQTYDDLKQCRVYGVR